MKPNDTTAAAYADAQAAMATLKSAVCQVLVEVGQAGLRNADVGRGLGIYTGHVGHEGHISRALRAIMEAEGVAEQDAESKLWRLKEIDTEHQSAKGEQVLQGFRMTRRRRFEAPSNDDSFRRRRRGPR